MLPVLLDLTVLKIYTFGVFLVLAFFWGSYFLWKNISLTSYKEEDIFDGLFIALGGGLFMGRLFYVIINFDKFGFDILKFILINGYPGLSLLGLLLGGFLALVVYFKLKKIKFWEIIDYFISPLFLALSITKLGSFLAGVEVGTKTNFFIAVSYVGFDGKRHLTAFYESLFFLGAFFFAQKMLFYLRREKLSKGFLLIFFGWFFSLVSFSFDFLKNNNMVMSKSSLSHYAYGILLLTFSLYFIYYFKTFFLAKLKSITNLFHLWQHTSIKPYPKSSLKNSKKS